MTFSTEKVTIGLGDGTLTSVHHIAFNVKNMEASCHFYGKILGLHQLTGAEVPKTLVNLVQEGKVANFKTPDGTIIDLFYEPELDPPDANPDEQFTRANHLAFGIEPELFDRAVAILQENEIAIASGPVTRPTGRGVYFYDPDGFMIEIRCDPLIEG
ncbi:Glyoxalase [Hyella patelloides LEGE 07179]|uniref:Glyoxalase n=1 Tax=Hyella patelloides LEGE 07179 TaxID=945734 RepID=A0A563VK55_9CYAN|nr:VOC family protein [Hyella patelloides]VEP11782.1 Glyoxalase [Hyella patelloides LEGE 07179]